VLALLPRVGHLLAQRVHEHRGVIDVHSAEVGIGLAADGVERHRALRRAEARQRADHRGEVARRIGEALVERDADRLLVGRRDDRLAGVGELMLPAQGLLMACDI
jgi:hypothetical protein